MSSWIVPPIVIPAAIVFALTAFDVCGAVA